MKRFGWQMLVGSLGLWPCLGCLTSPPTNEQLVSPARMAGSGSAHKDKDLPPDEAAQLNLRVAQNLESQGQFTEALTQYELARQHNPHVPDVSTHLAVLYDQVGNFAQAEVEFQKALAAHPKDADLLSNLGYHYYNRGQWAEAEKYLRQAIALAPQNKYAWNNLGLCLGEQQRYDESLQAFSKVVTPGQAYCNVAFVLLSQGKREEARRTYHKALEMEPDLRVAQGELAKLDAPPPPANQSPPALTKIPGQGFSMPRPPEPPAEAVLPPAVPVEDNTPLGPPVQRTNLTDTATGPLSALQPPAEPSTASPEGRKSESGAPVKPMPENLGKKPTEATESRAGTGPTQPEL